MHATFTQPEEPPRPKKKKKQLRQQPSQISTSTPKPPPTTACNLDPRLGALRRRRRGRWFLLVKPNGRRWGFLIVKRRRQRRRRRLGRRARALPQLLELEIRPEREPLEVAPLLLLLLAPADVQLANVLGQLDPELGLQGTRASGRIPVRRRQGYLAAAANGLGIRRRDEAVEPGYPERATSRADGRGWLWLRLFFRGFAENRGGPSAQAAYVRREGIGRLLPLLRRGRAVPGVPDAEGYEAGAGHDAQEDYVEGHYVLAAGCGQKEGLCEGLR